MRLLLPRAAPYGRQVTETERLRVQGMQSRSKERGYVIAFAVALKALADGGQPWTAKVMEGVVSSRGAAGVVSC